MRLLVTGASGLAGSHVIRAAADAGHHVRALVRPSSDLSAMAGSSAEIVYGDITDPASLSAAVAGCDAVIHTAALVSDWAPWEQFFLVGVRGTQNVLQAAVAAGVRRFVHLSSIGVYGARLHGRTLRESDPYDYQPENWAPYVKQKVQSEQLAFAYHRRGDLEVVAVRPSAIWGAGDRTFYPRTAAILASPMGAIVGRGSNRLPSISARDVADVCVRAATLSSATGRAYNVSSNEELTQVDLMTAVAETAGLAPPKRHVSARLLYGAVTAMETAYSSLPLPGSPLLTRYSLLLIASDSRVDTTLVRTELNWTELQPVREAVAECGAAARAARPS